MLHIGVSRMTQNIDVKEILKITLGSVSLYCAMSQPIVSTGATNRERMSLIASYTSLQLLGGG